ncbi:MAG: phosphotransferase [Dehalococcoidia bacterium]
MANAVEEISMITNIPSKPEELTASWLSDALHGGGYLTDACIERVSIELLDPTLAVFGTLARLHLEYSTGAEDLPPTKVAKLPSSNPNSAERLRLSGGGRTEVCFYQQVGSSIGLRVPQCFFSVVDETDSQFVLLLEDLSAHRSPSATDLLTENEITSVVRSLAASHAAWWEHPRLTELDWLRAWSTDGRSGQSSRFLVGWEILVERLGGGDPQLAALGEQIVSAVSKAEERMASSPTTLLHMDVRQENLFFAGPEENPEPIFIDWQAMRCGRGALSLASFLAFLPQRDRLEDRLLALYHSELERAGVINYPFEEFIQDYRVAILRRFSAPTAVMGAVGPDSPQGIGLLDLLSRFGMVSLERYLNLLSDQ